MLLSFVALTGVAASLLKWIEASGYSAFVVLLYILLGTFLDPIRIILLITPQIELNVFVIKSVVGDSAPLEAIFKGVLVFLAPDLLILWLLFQFPGFALILPNSAF